MRSGLPIAGSTPRIVGLCLWLSCGLAAAGAVAHAPAQPTPGTAASPDSGPADPGAAPSDSGAPPPDPRGPITVLLLLDQNFGANYNLLAPGQSSIRDHFARYGWKVTVTGLAEHLDSCAAYGAQFGARGVTVDTLLADIKDLGYYDCLTIMPGQAHSAILASPAALATVRAAAERGLIVSAWCRAVRVLAAADLIRGRQVVGHADYAGEYAAAGATYLGNDHPPVLDGNILTSVRSRFYRTATCEAIGRAVEENRRRR